MYPVGINMNSLVDCFCGVFLGNTFDSHSALKFKISASAFIRGTGIYLRSSVYSKLNLHVTDSHPILVIATKKVQDLLNSTLVQLGLI